MSGSLNPSCSDTATLRLISLAVARSSTGMLSIYGGVAHLRPYEAEGGIAELGAVQKVKPGSESTKWIVRKCAAPLPSLLCETKAWPHRCW